MNRKKLICLVSLLTCFLLLLGCSKKSKPATFTVGNLVESNSATSAQMNFAEFNGYRDKEIETEGTVSMHIVCGLEAGSFEIIIMDKKGNAVYQQSAPIDGIITLNGPAKYTLRVGGTDATGAYAITWEQVVT